MTWIEIVVNAIIPTILMIVTYKILPPVVHFLKDKQAYSIAVTACKAAEQLWNSGVIQDSERYKKASELIKNKLKLSDAEIQMLIEAVVGGGDHVSVRGM